MRAQYFACFVIVAAASQLGASECGGPSIITDPGFDLWCNEQLCAWHVDRGEAKKAETWHGKDAGVELLGVDTAISQWSQTDDACIEFSFIANVDPTVDLRLEADVYNDGTIEYSEHIPTARWQPLTYRMRFARYPDGVLFRFTKRGQGTAVLAQLEAQAVYDCEGLPTIALSPATNGYGCAEHADCRTGICDNGVCSDCLRFGLDEFTCTGNTFCSTVDPSEPNQENSYACAPLGSRELGERCRANEECNSQICSFGRRCSACGPGYNCDVGQACAQSVQFRGPDICAPGQFAGSTGAACFTNADCASAICNGTVMQLCPDGRTCTTTADCPAQGSIQHGACVPVGVQGGTCS